MRPSPAAREAWRLMGEIFWNNRRDWVDRLAEIGLNPMQAMAIRSLDGTEPTPMGRLAETLRCDNSNVTGIADRLEEAGLAERRPSPQDRRVKGLVLTPAGVEMRSEVERRWSEPPAAIAALGDEDAKALLALLRRAAAP